MTLRRPLWRRRLLPAFFTLLAFNLLVLVAWTGPRSLRLRNATARVEAARETTARAREETALLEERAQAIRANSADLERFYESVIGPEETHLVPTLRDIDRMSRAPGLRPGPRQFRREQVDDATVERLAVTVPLEGSYEELVGFLQEIESSPRFLTIDGIALTGARTGGAQLQVDLSAYMGLPPGTPVRRGRGVAR